MKSATNRCSRTERPVRALGLIVASIFPSLFSEGHSDQLTISVGCGDVKVEISGLLHNPRVPAPLDKPTKSTEN